MKVRVKLRLLSIKDDLELEMKEGETIKHLLEKLEPAYGKDLKKLVGNRTDQGFKAMAILNGKFVKPSQRLKDGDELYLTLPVAGG